MSIYIVIVSGALLVSCGETIVEVTGLAGNAKMGPVIVMDNKGVVYVKGGEWPEDMIGKKVTIKGRIKKVDDMPVYLVDGSGIERSGVRCLTKAEMEIRKWRDIIEPE